MGRRKNPPIMWSAGVVSTDQTDNKKIELQIAKKRYEIDVLSIELKYLWSAEDPNRKIWFTTN